MSDTYWLATSLSFLAIVSQSRGDYERATKLYEESMDLFREQGDKHSLAYCLNNLGMVVYSQGDLGRAAQLTEEGRRAIQGARSQSRRLYGSLQPGMDSPAPRRSGQGC